MRVLWLLIGVIFLNGCLVTTYNIEKPRVDIDHSKGNAGYLAGTPKPREVNTLGETRDVTVVEVEYGMTDELKRKQAEKKARKAALRAEKARKKKAKKDEARRKKAAKRKKHKSRIPTYVRREPVSVIDDEISQADTVAEVEDVVNMDEDVQVEIIDVAPVYETYVIQKGDTLQKVSKKFYGTTKKWKKIYNANTDVLKGPNKIYPGLKIKILAMDD